MYTCRLCCLIVCLAGLVGCGSSGPQRAEVTGEIMLDGKPIPEGRIRFTPAVGTQGTSAGAEITDGMYTIPAEQGPALGKYRVEISWSKKTGKQIEMGSPAPPGTKVDEVIEAIPAKYNSQSTLEREIDSPKTTQGFDLSSK